MYELLISIAIVALAEMGDKTQLLALLLAARFRKPVPILLAILFATLLNHGISAVLGQWITTVLSPVVLLWIVSVGFIAMALWMLVPDELEDETDNINKWQKIWRVWGNFCAVLPGRNRRQDPSRNGRFGCAFLTVCSG